MPDKLTYKKINSFDDNKKFFYNFFLQNGYAPHVSAGIVGNLIQESNLDYKIDKSTGFGAAQWVDSRKADLFNFSKQKGYKPSDIVAQAEFILHELNSTHKEAKTFLMGSKNVQEATEAFSNYYERPGKPMMTKRVDFANSVYDSMGAKNNVEEPTWKWLKKNSGVKVENLDKNILSYLGTLEPEYQGMLLATAGSDGKHSELSRHYNNKAIDLRFNDALWKRIEKDPNRLKYGITLLNPNHGTAKHIHFSVGNATENKDDIWLDPHSEKAYAMINGMSDTQTHGDYDAEKQTLSQTPLDDSYIRKELAVMNERFQKQDDDNRAEAENEAIRNQLMERQKERDFLIAQTLSAKLPFIERGY